MKLKRTCRYRCMKSSAHADISLSMNEVQVSHTRVCIAVFLTWLLLLSCSLTAANSVVPEGDTAFVCNASFCTLVDRVHDNAVTEQTPRLGYIALKPIPAKQRSFPHTLRC